MMISFKQYLTEANRYQVWAPVDPERPGYRIVMKMKTDDLEQAKEKYEQLIKDGLPRNYINILDIKARKKIFKDPNGKWKSVKD